MNNPFKSEGDNVNAFDLVQSIAFLLDTRQWNEMMKFSAASTPKDFIKMVESFRQNEESLKLLGPQEVDFWLMDPGINRINTIKIIRELGQLGLADSKYISEITPCKLFESTYNSDVIMSACDSFHNCGAKIMIKNRSGNESVFKKFAAAPRTTMSWVRNAASQSPPIDTLY